MRTKDEYELAKRELDYEEEERRAVINDIRVIVWLSLPVWYAAFKLWPDRVNSYDSICTAILVSLCILTLSISLIYLLLGFVGRPYKILQPMQSFFGRKDTYRDQLLKHDNYKNNKELAEEKANASLNDMLTTATLDASIANRKTNTIRHKHVTNSRIFLIIAVVILGVSGIIHGVSSLKFGVPCNTEINAMTENEEPAQTDSNTEQPEPTPPEPPPNTTYIRGGDESPPKTNGQQLNEDK